MSFAISSDPLSAATSGASSSDVSTPGNSCPTLASTTPVSPSDGSTASMYCRNERDGPTMSTPLDDRLLAVRVEQVRGAVQRDGRLAGAGAALHDERAAELGADDGILLGLDRRDDVAHAPGALGGERRHQRSLALQAGDVAVQQFCVEDLVVDAHDVAAVAGQVAPGTRTERCRGGGLVERPGLRHSPVEQQRLHVVVAQADPADVAVGRGIPVRLESQPAEREPLVDVAQLGDAVLVDAGERVPLRVALVGAGLLQPHRVELHLRLVAQGVEARVEGADVLTLS